MVGRIRERQELEASLSADEAQLIAVCGRRRVGKTYLVRESFHGKFFFEHAGIMHGTMVEQLAEFADSLRRAGLKDVPELGGWREAFNELERLIGMGRGRGKKVVFIDEMPWMDTPKSGFLKAFEVFWNGWCSGRKDVVFVICGSATSWIVKKVFRNKGGLYNRATGRIFLEPFTLSECRELMESRGIELGDDDLAEAYMIFGGVPYYWTLLAKGRSLAQNIDQLCFAAKGKLRQEFGELYASLFENGGMHLKLIQELARHKNGMTQKELLAAAGVSSGGNGKRYLEELEQSGFVRKFTSYGKRKRDSQYQLIDCFTLFHLKFIGGESNPDEQYWQHSVNSPKVNAWRGLAFERVCFWHVRQIKKALGVSGVVTQVYCWRHVADDVYPVGAQIDMLIERADHVVNVCEMKFSARPFSIDKDYLERLKSKMGAFEQVTKTRSAIHLTFVTTAGLLQNKYSGVVQSEVTLDDLLEK